MKGQWHESEDDRVEQELIARDIEAAWEVLIDHQGKHRKDFKVHLLTGALYCLGEAKRRDWWLGGDGEVYLSLNKAGAITGEARQLGLPWYWFARFNNGLHYARMHDPLLPYYKRKEFKREKGNRYGDKWEQVILVPYADFRPIASRPAELVEAQSEGATYVP